MFAFLVRAANTFLIFRASRILNTSVSTCAAAPLSTTFVFDFFNSLFIRTVRTFLLTSTSTSYMQAPSRQPLTNPPVLRVLRVLRATDTFDMPCDALEYEVRTLLLEKV